MTITTPDFISRQVKQRTTAVGQQVLDTAANIHSVAEQLRADAVTEKAAEIAEMAASAAERVGNYLKTSDVDTMLSDAESYSRERPWTVAVGGLLLGFSASRVLKAGAARRSFSYPRYPSS